MKKSTRLTNSSVAELLRDVAAAYQLKDEAKYRFQMIAYQKAADAVEHATSELIDIWEQGNLTEVPGIGKSMALHLDELFRTGTSKHFYELVSTLPPAMFELMKVPGIGPKKAFRLSEEFNLKRNSAITRLAEIAVTGAIAKLPGFGEESQADILQALNEFKIKPPERMLISTAYELSQEVIAWLKGINAVVEADTLGSLRRRASTVGDIDIAVATNDAEAVFDRFVAFPKAARTIERGKHSTSILLPGNIQVDVMVQPPEAYGSLLQHFTGSKHHNVALREYALKKGMSLSEYGVKPLENTKLKMQNGRFNKEKNLYQFKSEVDFYNSIGLEWIPPEIREDTGEIQSSLARKLPDLVELSDVKGDLQIHSDFDIETSHDVGASSMSEIATKAMSLGYEYIAFTEHNPSQKGHTPTDMVAILKRKRDVIEKLNYANVKIVKNGVFKMFNSLEVDILPTGKLPVSDEGLQTLDFALVSIHSSFKQTKADMTKRVLEGLSHPKVKIFAHPSARIINQRDSIDLDWEKVFEFCLKNNKYIEINAEPNRLDLPDTLVRMAKKTGVNFSLGTDSHQVSSLDNMKYGVFVARRGWLSTNDIINTKSLVEFEKLLI